MKFDSSRRNPEDTNRAEDPDTASFVVGGGETGALIRSLDWRTTRLGPARKWPQSLRTSIDICVSSRLPIAIYWGPEFVMLYNDDLIPISVQPDGHTWASVRIAPSQEWFVTNTFSF